jgi:hypothetical protein
MAKKIMKLRIDCPTEELFDKVSPWLKEYWSKEVTNTEISIPENDGDSYFIHIEGDLKDLFDDLLEAFEGEVFAEWES